jgi:hypothetical protein
MELAMPTKKGSRSPEKLGLSRWFHVVSGVEGQTRDF